MTTNQAELDRTIAELTEGSERWATTTLTARAELLARTAVSVAREAESWVEAAAEAKGLDPASALIGEEWLTGPYGVLTSLAVLRSTVLARAQGLSPLAGRRLGRAPGKRLTVPVLPNTAAEALLLHGFHARVWLRPGVTADQARKRAGLGQLRPTERGGVGVVLGAGNISSIGPLDTLYELFAHNRVSILKLNPTFATLLPVYLAALAPLIDAGVLRIVNGGADVGGYLVQHASIGHVHITGSAASHDAIVFGGADRSAPVLSKPISSELGGVAPIIVLPGRWSERDLRFQAEHVATQRLHNGGYNCIAGQVLVLSADWPQKVAFLEAVASALAVAPERPAWYPGSDERMRAARISYPDARELRGGRLLAEARTSTSRKDMLTTEYFAPVLGVVELPGTGQNFLDAAVDAANRDFVGTLGVNILGLPTTIRGLGTGFEQAVARLRYGTIAINAWTGVGFLTAAAPWGAFPGHTLDNVQSGIGVVHNALLLDDVERTVVRGPFRPFPRSITRGEWALLPKPPWFVSARSAAVTARRLTEFVAQPSVTKLLGILAAAFRA